MSLWSSAQKRCMKFEITCYMRRKLQLILHPTRPPSALSYVPTSHSVLEIFQLTESDRCHQDPSNSTHPYQGLEEPPVSHVAGTCTTALGSCSTSTTSSRSRSSSTRYGMQTRPDGYAAVVIMAMAQAPKRAQGLPRHPHICNIPCQRTRRLRRTCAISSPRLPPLLLPPPPASACRLPSFPSHPPPLTSRIFKPIGQHVHKHVHTTTLANTRLACAVPGEMRQQFTRLFREGCSPINTMAALLLNISTPFLRVRQLISLSAHMRDPLTQRTPLLRESSLILISIHI